MLVQSQFLGTCIEKKMWPPTAPFLTATACSHLNQGLLLPGQQPNLIPHKLISMFVIFARSIDEKIKFSSKWALFVEKNLSWTLKISIGYRATLSSRGECVGVKKETPPPPQGINNIHSYRGDRWETALALPHKPYLLLQLFNFATPTSPFLLFGVHAEEVHLVPCLSP